MFMVELVQGTEAGYSFVMNEPCYTQYPEEEEILLDDGLPFDVVKVERDERLTFHKFLGRKITRVHMRSHLPKGLIPLQELKLHTSCNFKEFLNNQGKQLEDRKKQWLCYFQTEIKDLKTNYVHLLHKKSYKKTTKEFCYKAAVSEDEKDGDGLYFERVNWVPAALG